MLSFSKSRFSYLLLFVLLIAFTGCKTSSELTGNSQNDSRIDRSADSQDLEALYWARRDSARMNFTQADVDFMTGMIAHHAQALIMSDLAPKNGASGSVRILASRIINAQNDEIESMQRWLRDRDQPVPEIHIRGLTLMIHGLGDHQHMDHTNMKGMLSPQQMQELSEAQGSDFDRLYLTYMISHHEGAVFMVEKLFDTDGAALDDEAFKMASDIQVDQRTEIARMQKMLDAMEDTSN